jgi:hypothetical protein
MRNEPHVTSAPASEKLELLKVTFSRLWSVDEASPFGRLLRAIDESVALQRCRARLARMHRMLDRY